LASFPTRSPGATSSGYATRTPTSDDAGSPSLPSCGGTASAGPAGELSGSAMSRTSSAQILMPSSQHAKRTFTAGAIVEAYQLFTLPGPRDTELEGYRGIWFLVLHQDPVLPREKCPTGRLCGLPIDPRHEGVDGTLAADRLPAACPARELPPRPDSSAYVQYVKTMHAWAAKLNVLPEVIEYYLWAEAAKSGSPLWPTCQAQHALEFP
jgi:hypothetical protein